MDPDGSFAIVSGGTLRNSQFFVNLYTPEGEPVLSFQPAVEKFKEHWWRGFGTQHGRELWLVSAERKQVWRFELP